MADKIKFVVALLLLVAGVFGFYALGEMPLVVRVLAVLAGVLLAAAVGLQSAPGKRFAVFAREAIAETRKVVWPSRKETMQTTMIVFVFVLLVSAFLWLVDKTLEWLLYGVLLGWK